MNISTPISTDTTRRESTVQQRDNQNSYQAGRLNIFDDDSNIIDHGYLKFNKLLKLCIYTTLLIIFSIFGLLALDITLSIETLDDSHINSSRNNRSIDFNNGTGSNN
jgi:hypothetical protein